jgi:hypothetical protein
MPRAGGSGNGEASERWVPLAAAPDQLTAELWVALLREQGIPALLNPGDVASFLGLSLSPVQVLIPEAFMEMARQVLEPLEETEESAVRPSNGHSREIV